jgi:hypothetical protein
MKLLYVVIVSLFLIACASMATSGFDKSNTVGRNVDDVIADIEQNGAKCGHKFREKSVNSNHISGSVNCGIKEKSVVCPKSYGIYLSYDLTTNKVTSIFKDERDNCF